MGSCIYVSLCHSIFENALRAKESYAISQLTTYLLMLLKKQKKREKIACGTSL